MTTTDLDTGTGDLLARWEGGVLTLTLNRPDAYNAMSVPMVQALMDRLAWAEKAENVRCVVLAGAGRGFCAGGDVKSMAEQGDAGSGATSLEEAIRRQQVAHRAVSGRLHAMGKPTLAAVQGGAVGAGMALALACDLRIVADTAFFTTAFAKVGLAGDFGASWFLVRLVGAGKARELMLLSDKVDAAAAERLGLANVICPADTLAETAASLAGRLARGPGVAYRYMKANLDRAVGGTLEECLDQEATYHLLSGLTADHREAAQAFVEKRAPVFVAR